MSKYLPSVLLAAAAFLLLSPSGCPSISLPVPIVQPKYDQIYAVVIEETQDRDEYSAVINSPLWDGMKILGVEHRFYDDDSPEAKPYIEVVVDRPGLLLLTKSGDVIRKGPLPKTAEEVGVLIKGYLNAK